MFTRLITDRAQAFDRIEPGYRGPLYRRDFAAHLSGAGAQGFRLNQLRVRHGSPQFTDTQLQRLHAETAAGRWRADIDNGLGLSIDLKGDRRARIGWRAKRHTGLIDVDLRDCARSARNIGSRLTANRPASIVLDPDEFYILASREAVAIPPDYAAEMVPFNPLVGEFRVHYAGFFDPGFGYEAGQPPAARGRAGSALPRSSVHPRTWPDHRPAGVRAPDRSAAGGLRAGDRVQLSAPGSEAFQALLRRLTVFISVVSGAAQ